MAEKMTYNWYYKNNKPERIYCTRDNAQFKFVFASFKSFDTQEGKRSIFTFQFLFDVKNYSYTYLRTSYKNINYI